MARNLEQFHRAVISGTQHGLAASIMRGAFLVIEPFYAGAVSLRNKFYDAGNSIDAGRPVVSVGNITTGGTGKTPVVRWLAQHLREIGRHPAILMRGYKSNPIHGSDEQWMLQSQLPGIIVEANPSRVEAAQRVLQAHPEIDVFVLDDGFQHRKLRRNFDLVLIDASNPFGFGHVLPRGLLREPLVGLARANAILITHAEQALSRQAAEKIASFNKPIFRCRHVLTNASEFAGKKVFAFCGIGNPAAFDRQIESGGAILTGSHHFADHHHYTQADMTMLRDLAADAEVLVTTEKDWVKLPQNDLKIICTELAIQFEADDESRLLAQIKRNLATDGAPMHTDKK